MYYCIINYLKMVFKFASVIRSVCILPRTFPDDRFKLLGVSVMTRNAGWSRLFLILVICLCCTQSLNAGSSWEIVPDDLLFPSPIADQSFPRFSLSFPVYVEQRIDTLHRRGDVPLREMLEFGGVQGLFRFASDRDNRFAAELCIGAGVITMFDSFEDNLDNFGWEGAGFLAVNFMVSQNVRMRFGYHHISSHVGDEYLAQYEVVAFPVDEGEDLLRGATYGLNYVRDSFTGGISVQIGSYARLYAELYYSRDMLRYMLCYNAFPWQANMGLEFQWPDQEIHTQRWYLAIHAAAFQESSWFPSTTIQFGKVMSLPKSNRQFRFGLEYYRGRVQLATFNHTESSDPTHWEDLQIESYVAIGAWYDL